MRRQSIALEPPLLVPSEELVKELPSESVAMQSVARRERELYQHERRLEVEQEKLRLQNLLQDYHLQKRLLY